MSKINGKVSAVNDHKRVKVEQALLHNLNEEKGVGFVNYEIKIKGKENLDSVSKKMVLNKSKDVLREV